MPQKQIGSANIEKFAFSVKFDLYNRQVIFNASATEYNGSGINNVLGIAFSLVDQDGVELTTIDWGAPQIPVPANSQQYILDLSDINFAFLFQTYKIIGSIKDADNNIYSTSAVYKKICQPVNFNDSGYVPGIFQLISDCTNNTLSVKELTLLVYNNLIPDLITKTGTLNYPTGTISAISFSTTPFSNNVIYTGQYRIRCTTVAKYGLGDDVYVDVSYLTSNVFDVTCNNRMSDILCCLVKVQDTYLKDCESATGKHARQLMDQITPSFLIGMTKEINGQDSSTEALIIKKALNCDCGSTSLGQNEVSPINASIYSIVINGVGGTSVPSAAIAGTTKTYNIASNVYQVVKGDTGDLAFSIATDTSVSNTVKYKITFNYAVMAQKILTAIASDPSLVNQLNSLVSAVANVSLVGLNGKCIIDMANADYNLLQVVNVNTQITGITINGVIHVAPSGLFATDFTGIGIWLNGLGLGSFTVQVNAGTLFIQALQNGNSISIMTFTTPSLTVLFVKTNKTLVQVIQAIISYLCSLTSLQVALGTNLSLSLFDYNGVPVISQYPYSTSQMAYNLAISQSINNIVDRINTLTGITCAKIKAIFTDSPGVAFGADDRVYGTLGGNCAALTDKDIATLVFAAVGKYSDVKTAFCAIDCSASTTCPDISGVGIGVAANSAIISGITWAALPSAVQTLSVLYRRTGAAAWITSTNALQVYPNGNLVGNSTYGIPNLSPGANYQILVKNTCGGDGYVQQVLIPTASVYQDSYLVNNIIYNLCAGSSVTLYSSLPFGAGTVMYTDMGLTTLATGYLFIAQANSGNIFQMNSGTAAVTTDTGTSCTNGTATNSLVGNNTATICATAISNRYTNGAFAVGKTLYTDSSLTTPVTGYAYVVNGLDGHVYNLNTVTGVIGADTAISCNSYILSVKLRYIGMGAICVRPTENVYISSLYTTLQSGIILYSDAGLTTPKTGVIEAVRTSAGSYVFSVNFTSGEVGLETGVIC